jgi:hypothetical protein
MIARAGAIESYRLFFAALGMGAEIHDMATAGDKAAIGATCRALTPARTATTASSSRSAGRKADTTISVAATSRGTATPGRISRRQKVSRCFYRTVRHARRARENVQGRFISGSRTRPGLQAAGWPCCAITAKIA